MMTTRSRDADMTAVTTIVSVCSQWHDVIAERKWNQQHIRRLIRCNFFWLLVIYVIQ